LGKKHGKRREVYQKSKWEKGGGVRNLVPVEVRVEDRSFIAGGTLPVQGR